MYIYIHVYIYTCIYITVTMAMATGNRNQNPNHPLVRYIYCLPKVGNLAVGKSRGDGDAVMEVRSPQIGPAPCLFEKTWLNSLRYNLR